LSEIRRILVIDLGNPVAAGMSTRPNGRRQAMRHSSTAAFAVFLTLLAARGSPGQDPGGLKGRLDAIIKAQESAKQRFNKELEGTTTEEAQKPAIDRYIAEVARNTGEVLDLARANPTDPRAVEALRFVIVTVGRGPGDESYRAMEILLRDHVRDPGMGDVCGRIFHFTHSPIAESLLRAVIEGHPNCDDRGLACQSLAWLLDHRADLVRAVRQGQSTVDDYVNERFKESTKRLIKESDPAALDRESEALLERCAAEFADVKDWFMPDRTIGIVAEGELFARRRLSEGQVVPEITGKDHEGKSFALSGYRGKVVVLTFSASWCGPCVGMYPHERELVKKLADRPFALVSVHSGQDVATLKKSIASGEITWRCWWDEGMYGPITTRWGVSIIPEVFVLDRAGVIRKKSVRGAELEKTVMALLEEESADTPASK
jgi:thiol-disulfide isomerase/thioredoxin